LAEAEVSCNKTNVNSKECEPQKIQAELRPELDAPEAAEPSPGIMHFVTGENANENEGSSQGSFVDLNEKEESNASDTDTLSNMMNEEIEDCKPVQNITYDPATYVEKDINAALKKKIILNGAFQPTAKEMKYNCFPKSISGDHFRSFNESWYKVNVGNNTFKREWLAYSPMKDAVYCHLCVFFSRNKDKETPFTKTGFRDWKKALVKFSKHEQSGCHVDSSVDYVNFCTKIAIDEQLSDAARQTSMARQKRVEKNRNVMKRLIDITLFLAKQGLAFRGHREDITTETTNKGNFLALAELLSKYDEILASHLSEIKKEKQKKKQRKNIKKNKRKGRGNLVTFLSADSQNKIIESIGDKLLQKIVCEIKSAGIYSIAMDCTTDASHADQLSLIIRYLNDSYDITERLVNIQRVKDSSAKGLLATLRDILSKNSINLSDAVGQSYDGASVMRGKYNGLKSLIQKESSKCLFIWTFDHVLNLVIMEACSSSIAAKSLFGFLEKLYAFFSASRKRSDILEEKQKIANISQNHRPQRVSTTRWWSHQRALDNVFFSQSESLYDCFIDTLNDCQSPSQSNETVNDAEALERKLTSFETVLTAHLFKRIFAITDPASSYLQSEKIDFLTAIRLVETAEQQLRQLRDEFGVILTQAKEFCASHELEQQNFVKKRTRKRKRMADEIDTVDEVIEENPACMYRRETFLYAIDTSVRSINERFSSHKAILADFALLDPECFKDHRSSNTLPSNAFKNVAQNYGQDSNKLKEEYASFVEIYPNLKESSQLSLLSESNASGNSDLNRENFLTALKLLAKYNLKSAYPNLFCLYKILVTLPIGSTKCERTFSKLKYVKNRLRSTMGQARLNALMLVNVEGELVKQLNYEDIIDSFAASQLLQNMLL